jgi:hypothetical protein
MAFRPFRSVVAVRYTAEVRKLATESAIARRVGALDDLRNECRRTLNSLVAKGVHGGPTLNLMLGHGMKALLDAGMSAATELARAGRSFSVTYYAGLLDDLLTAWDELVPEDPSAYSAIILDNCGPVPSQSTAKDHVAGALLQTRMRARLIARSDLGHYVAQLRAARTAELWKNGRAIVTFILAGVIGAVLAESVKLGFERYTSADASLPRTAASPARP